MDTILLVAALACSAIAAFFAYRASKGAGSDGLLVDLRQQVTEMREQQRIQAIDARRENNERFRENREELSRTLSDLQQMLALQATDAATLQHALIRDILEETAALQRHVQAALRESRMEQADAMDDFALTLSNTAKDLRAEQKEARRMQEEQLEKIRSENSKKLDQMQRTVDEKLEDTLERRFDSSFRMISERLEQVHRGLGEMHKLADGVGDLKRVLTNVKTRGTLGEIQLEAILEQMLSPSQYVKNAYPIPGSDRHVEFAIRLPGQEQGRPVLLPIDSKFPMETYQRMADLSDAGAPATEIESQARQLEAEIRKCARDISDKYVCPPYTTDFGVLFVPTEGLYAEILRRPGLFETLQRELRVTVVGPSTLCAFLSSLQMGFRTLAIEKRSSEVWSLLGNVKTEFGKFGEALAKVRKKLSEAANVVENADRRTRVMERKLKDVEAAPLDELAPPPANIPENRINARD